MSNKYATIKTTAELEKAIQSVHAQRKKVEKHVGKDVNRMRSGLKPTNLMLGAVRRYSPMLSWTGIALGLVRGAKKLLK